MLNKLACSILVVFTLTGTAHAQWMLQLGLSSACVGPATMFEDDYIDSLRHPLYWDTAIAASPEGSGVLVKSKCTADEIGKILNRLGVTPSTRERFEQIRVQ